MSLNPVLCVAYKKGLPYSADVITTVAGVGTMLRSPGKVATTIQGTPCPLWPLAVPQGFSLRAKQIVGGHFLELMRSQELIDDTLQEGLRMDGWMDRLLVGWLAGWMNDMTDQWIMVGWMIQRGRNMTSASS